MRTSFAVEADDRRRGRERIADGNGGGKAAHHAPRDYFRVETDDGQRFWLYRDGLYHQAAAPRWYLHGMFA